MMSKLVILLATLLLLTPAIASANVLGDPGFEGAGNAGVWITDNWGGPWDNNYDATDQWHAGSQSLKQVANGTNVPTPTYWEKAEAKQIFSIQPGYVINGGAWLKWDNLGGSGEKADAGNPWVEAFIESKWLRADFSEISGIGTVHKTSGSGDWEYQDLSGWTVAERTAPADAAYVDYRLVFLSPGNANNATGTVWWDDAQFTVIPEPTSLLLLGSGLVGLLALNRKKR